MKRYIVLLSFVCSSFAMEQPEQKKNVQEPTIEQMQFTLDKLERAIDKVQAAQKAETANKKIPLKLSCINAWLGIRKDYERIKRYHMQDEFIAKTYGLTRDEMEQFPVFEKKMIELSRTDQR